jgi:hypothetical protein
MLDFSSIFDLHTSTDCREFVRTQKDLAFAPQHWPKNLKPMSEKVISPVGSVRSTPAAFSNKLYFTFLQDNLS